MKKLAIDFGAPRRPMTWHLGWAALCCGLALLGVLAWQALAHAEVRAPLESEQHRLMALLKQEPAAPAALPAPWKPERLEQVSAAVRKLGVPWNALLSGIEASMGEHVTLLGMEAQEAQGTLVLRAESRDFDAALDFVRRVEDLPLLSDAHMDHHQVNVQDPHRPVQFVVVARWWAIPSVVPAIP